MLKALEGPIQRWFVVVFGFWKWGKEGGCLGFRVHPKKMGCEEENLVLIPSLSTDFNGVCGQRNGFLPPMAGHGGDGGLGGWPQGMVGGREVKVSAGV